MPWVPPLVAALVAVATGWSTPWLLRGLPEPLDDPDVATKTPYTHLASKGFALGVGVTTWVAGTIVVTWTPADLWLAWCALAVIGVVSVAIDLRTTWLPLPLARAGWAVAATGVALAAAIRRDASPLVWAAVGALGLWALFEVMWRLTGGFGYGDVRLMATVGAVTGAHDPLLVLPAALAGTVIGAGWGVVYALRGRGGPFPYGPALLAGPFVALAWWSLAR